MATDSSATFDGTFAPMYYNSPVDQAVFSSQVPFPDVLTASITAGSAYFKVTKLAVTRTIYVPPGHGRNPQDVSAIPSTGASPTTDSTPQEPTLLATSDGVTPLTIETSEYITLWITAEVPEGSALTAGATFTGTALIKGSNYSQAVGLKGTYLGGLMGKVTVTPATVVPGQPVLVQVCNAQGNPLSDPTVTVAIQGVQASAIYYQFPTIGTRNFIVVVSRGGLSETASFAVNVAGTPLAFRPSLVAPTATELPMINVARVMGQPYTATFTLGNTAGVRRVLAEAIAQQDATHPTTSVSPIGSTPTPVSTIVPIPTPVSQTPSDPLGIEFAKVLATLPASAVTRIGPTTTKTATGTATSSLVLAAVGGLKTVPEATSYQWDFGDGQTLTTQSATATHNYFSAVQAGDVARGFHVTCTIVQDKITVKRTVVLHSAYGLCKRLGVIVPPVIGDAYATFQQVAFSAWLIVTNLEASAITLGSMACVPVSDDVTAAPPAPQFTTMTTPVVVAANSSSVLGVYIPLNQLQLAGAVVNGFTVYYSGSMLTATGWVPVRFSYMFRIPITASGLANSALPSQLAPAAWNLTTALQAVTAVATQATGGVSKAGGQTVDPATRTVAIALTANPQTLATLIQVRTAVQAGLTSIALQTGALTAKGATLRLTPLAPKPSSAPQVGYDPLNPPPVAVNAVCYPDDISDADAATAAAEQLVCQLTSDTETVTIPAQFQNAQAGDIILSPAPVGEGDMIAAMFAALTPPQHHGHSGIMTANFFEITHCTAFESQITANVIKNSLGIPTSLNPEMLQYAWPGSVTQSIDDATNSVTFKDPSGASYSMISFNTDSRGDVPEVIPPLVVKPLPENEATARPLLRKAAATARSKGAQYDSSGNRSHPGGCYYSFYAYTDPQISAGFTDAAGAAAGWAQGMSPAVCSSFIWLSLKENSIPLVSSNAIETLSDFSASAVAGGAQVGPATLDGLIYYPQADRLQGANALYNLFMNQALSKEDGLGTIPGVNQAIAGPIADQLLNVFASNNPNLVGSTAWQNPGTGNAVSPDNIIWWNPPYYGYAEPLQFLPPHIEQYTVSKWAKVITWGTITGTVRLNGTPVPNALVWVYLPGVESAANGTYTLTHVPIGPYQLQAEAVVTTNGVSVNYTNGAGTNVTLTAANPNISQDIELQGLPQNYRRLDITYSLSCDHGDNNPWDPTGVENFGPDVRSMDVNPGNPTNSLGYTFDYHGGGFFRINYQFSIALVDDLSIAVTLVGTMYDDGSGDVQTQYSTGQFYVAVGATQSGTMTLEHSNGYHNGPAYFTFSLTNNQQTG